jgi:hypothetical protein
MINALRKNNKSIEKSDDKKISIALMSSFVVLTIQYFILVYFDLLGSSEASGVQLLSKVLVGIAFAFALPSVIKRNKIKFIVTYFVTVFIFLVNYIIFPENHLYLKELIFPFFFMSLPAFVYSVSLRDWNTLKQIMKKASLIIFIFGALLGTLIFLGKASAGVYSMSLSYYMLLPTIIFLDELMNKFSLKSLFLFIISFFVILALGSRGAILCIIVFIALKLVRFNFKLSYSKVLYYVITLGTIIFTFIYLDRILNFIYNLFSNIGIGSRTIFLFLSEDVHLSGRDNIYKQLMGAIFDNPILGLGFAADRRILGGEYAHNFFLEVITQFGVLFGGIILFILILLILKSLLTRNTEKYSMVIIWLSLGFVHLMVSSSYLIDIKFWILLGIIVNSQLHRRVN